MVLKFIEKLFGEAGKRNLNWFKKKIRIRSRQQRVRYTAIVEIFGGLKLRISISDRI